MKKTVELGRLAVDSGMWVLYEVVNGETRITYRPTNKRSVKEYIAPQKRFRHLKDRTTEKIQKDIDERWNALLAETPQPQREKKYK